MKAKNTVTTAIPTLRYQEAPATIQSLCRAFGFERHRVVPGDADAAEKVSARGRKPLRRPEPPQNSTRARE